MTAVAFDKALFRQLFPEFAAVSDAVLQVRWDEASGYVSTENCGDLLDLKRAQAVMYCTAHLLRIAATLAAGGAGSGVGVVTAATIDKVTVQLSPPPGLDGWSYWLSTTPYGLQLVAYLKAQATGGFYYGGMPERAAFRKVGGIF